MNWRKLRSFLIALALLALIPATRYYQIDLPILRLFSTSGQVDPLSLHLAGEFVEDNLGSERNPDGSVTLRMVAQQYLFVPQCVTVPTGAPVHLRITSADNVHLLTLNGTNDTVKAIPGTVTEAKFEFANAAVYKMPCREFCGAGHYAMRSELRVVPAQEFDALPAGERGKCGAQ